MTDFRTVMLDALVTSAIIDDPNTAEAHAAAAILAIPELHDKVIDTQKHVSPLKARRLAKHAKLASIDGRKVAAILEAFRLHAHSIVGSGGPTKSRGTS